MWFLVFVPVVVVLHYLGLRSSRQKSLRFANFEAVSKVMGKGRREPMNLWMLFSRLLVVVFLVLAVSGATLRYVGEASNSDYVIALDASSSMLAEDLTPNRFVAAKEAALAFIDSLPPRAKVGLVTFGGTSFIRAAPTEDLAKVKNELRVVDVSDMGGTAIGEALVSSSNLLQDREAARTIILLTDGQNNVGIDIDDALVYARNLSIIVHTIGIGTAEGGSFGGVSIVSTLDSEALKEISSATSGEYFQATDAGGLKERFVGIASSKERLLETDLTGVFLLVSLVLISIEWMLGLFKYARLEW